MAAGKSKSWVDLGPADKLKERPLWQIEAGGLKIALIYKGGAFSAVSGECNHEKGPLGKGRMDGDYVVCPWHGWAFHRETGHGKPPYETACLPRYEVKEEDGRLLLNKEPISERVEYPHPPDPLSREVRREPGPLRVAGISATAMSKSLPRYSTSESLLQAALEHAGSKFGAQTRLIKLRDLKFSHCGGFYSIDERACTWPCTYTQIDPKDQMREVYEALVFWADVVLVATSIRWGNASSLYYKMAERLNCVENRALTGGKRLVVNKPAAFIITGGQDNVQSVAGNMMAFFGQLGFSMPERPFVGHSRGWSAEDMDNNIEYVRSSEELFEQVKGLVERAAALAAVGAG